MNLNRPTIIPFGNYQANSIDYLVGILHDARVTTLQRIHNLSTEELHWQFAPKWNSIGALLSHIIACEHYFRVTFLENQDFNTEESQLYTAGLELGEYVSQLITDQTIDFYIQSLEHSRQLLLNQLKKINEESFIITKEGYGSGCNLAWVLYHMAEDEIHHRGQISIIRKLYASKH